MYYYGVDLREVINGDGPAPSFVVSLIDGLPEGSMTVAHMRGGDEDYREYIGRDATWYVLADTYDAVNQNTRATGNWKKGKTPQFVPYPRPGFTKEGKPKKDKRKKSEAQPRKGLADLYGQMTGAPLVPKD